MHYKTFFEKTVTEAIRVIKKFQMKVKVLKTYQK